MNDILYASLLGILQGLTEFLPVSSSAHLILLPKFLGWKDFGLSFDIVLHLGSLIAIIGYFLQEQELKKKIFSFKEHKILLLIIIATIPVGLSGLLFKHFVENNLRSIELIAITTIIFGLLLGIAEYWNKYYKKNLTINQLSIKDAMLIGCAQAIAIIPGISRSGITLTAGMFLGFSSKEAAKFSFLLAIPVILLAAGLQFYQLIINNNLFLNSFTNNNLTSSGILILISGFISSMCSSFIFIFLFLRFINYTGILLFVIYRIVLGSLLWIYIK